MNSKSSEKVNWLYFTPCFVAMLICIIMIAKGILEIKKSEGWSIIEIVIYSTTLVLLSIIDFSLKAAFKNKKKEIWIIESIIIALVFYFFKEYFIY